MNPIIVALAIIAALIAVILLFTKPLRVSIPFIVVMGVIAGAIWLLSMYASIVGGCLVVWFVFKLLAHPMDDSDKMIASAEAHALDKDINPLWAYLFLKS